MLTCIKVDLILAKLCPTFLDVNMCTVDQGSISPPFYAQLLHAQIPKAQQIHLHLSFLSLFALLGFEHVKATHNDGIDTCNRKKS